MQLCAAFFTVSPPEGSSERRDTPEVVAESLGISSVFLGSRALAAVLVIRPAAVICASADTGAQEG
jgi:hypothetical protein